MAAINTVATGVQIVTVMGVVAQAVGAFDAAAIDADVAQNTPYSNPEEALAWIREKLTAGQYDPDSLTDLEATYAWRAQRLYSWVFYWRASRQHSACPEACADPGKYAENLNRAKKMLCEALKKLGLTDDEFCKAASSGFLKMIGFSTSKFPEQ